MKKVIYLALDLETGGFCTPYYNEAGEYRQGAQDYSILQVASVLTDERFCEYPFTAVDEYVSPAPNTKIDQGTWEFHLSTGFANIWTGAKRESLYNAESKILDSILETLVQEELVESTWTSIPAYGTKGNTFTIILLGKSVHFDRKFIDHQMPRLASVLSHQHLDVSNFRTILTGSSQLPARVTANEVTHFAMDDVQVALAEARVYRLLQLRGLHNLDTYDSTLEMELKETATIDHMMVPTHQIEALMEHLAPYATIDGVVTPRVLVAYLQLVEKLKSYGKM
jgi:hypothetical protein